MDVEAKLASLVRKTFNIPKKHNLSNAGLGKTPNWTSLMHIKLIVLIEKNFNVKISSNLILKSRDFKSILQELRNILESKK